ncbi:MAG: hypothetical protein GYA42_09870, partial [Syntrophomonadaceae bacterium]|nr:hypothetical protein [Syntrophomonadaceae bacterium]
HGCEYMTGGKAVILGKTGRNFAAGMSGGIAYILDFETSHCNQSMVLLEPLVSTAEIGEIEAMIRKHVEYTGSPLGRKLLDDWDSTVTRFTKVIPIVYKRVLEEMSRSRATGRKQVLWPLKDLADAGGRKNGIEVE